MFTDEYCEAMYYGSCVAKLNGSEDINILHLLSGILHVKKSNVAMLLNEYGITIDLMEKHNIKCNIEKFHIMLCPVSDEVVSIRNEAIVLANHNKVGLEHLASRLVRKDLVRAILQKLFNSSDWECLVHQLRNIVDKKRNGNNFLNQVTIE